MNLEQLVNLGKLKYHKTSPKEISELLNVINRDIKDAKVKGISSDRKFATAYNAILQLATILLYCKGYKPEGAGHHFTVFQAMKEIMVKEYHKLADYFDSCRVKRNIADYTNAGRISEAEAEELVKESEEFLKTVLNWISTNCPSYYKDKLKFRHKGIVEKRK
jgi:uncharacterized protein (UPF0332 family)